MENKKLNLLVVMLLLLVFSSCTSNDDSTPSDEVLFNAKINGELFEATKIEQSTVIQHSELGQRFSISVENDNYKIIFVLVNKNFSDCMLTGGYDNLDNDTEILLDVYHKVPGTNNFISPYFPVENSDGIVQQIASISSCDNKIVTGTFSGSLYNIDDSGNSVYPESLEITEGKFQNIEYILLSR